MLHTCRSTPARMHQNLATGRHPDHLHTLYRRQYACHRHLPRRDETARLIASLDYVEKVELLPYHTLGTTKYQKLDIKYPLEGVEAMNVDRLKELSDILFEKIEYYKQNR